MKKIIFFILLTFVVGISVKIKPKIMVNNSKPFAPVEIKVSKEESVTMRLNKRTMAADKEYTYKFNFKGDGLSVKLEAPPLTLKINTSDYNEGLRIAAKKCFDFYKDKVDILNEEKGLDVIDVCANPR